MPTIQELIDELEAEINNGGFDQFFFNSAGDHTEETIQALLTIGANHTANILKKAACKFPGGMPPKDRNIRQELLEDVSPDSDAFEDLDEEFLAYKDNLASLVSGYEG
ncbi:DMP19 family protein [Shewanella sedimentimangrovi]|uniref:DMP19 family protein n=1 Tax=Shewanella sedimentimangrovi TaxID=2814293 RepID=A0ABX7R3Y2_9GAMM|nr:DUF4375 domain-containing protein [Shewanella sedimentimangrovi]QSX38194.1 DMP19 family protein [Shewanella sedimentimangrovi]